MIPNEAIEAAMDAYYGDDVEHGWMAREQMEAAITAALAAMPGPAVKVEYANRSTGGFTPATDLASENERLRAALETINAAASKEYCASLRQFEEKECLGWEAKVASGKFGKAEHEAHKRANMLMGKAQGLWEASKIARAALERT